MSSMEPEYPERLEELVQIFLIKKNAYIFYDIMRHLPFCDLTPKQEEVFESVLDQLQYQTKD